MSQYPKTEITPLLESVIKDNPTYPFPVDIIRTELIQLYIHQEEFEYFMMQCYKILKRDTHIVFANIFLTILEEILDTIGNDPQSFTKEIYQEKIDEFISLLETINITRIDKKSPDGEMLSAMI